MSTWFLKNVPKTGEEWKPSFSLGLEIYLSPSEEKFWILKEFEGRVWVKAEQQIRNPEVHEGVIVDPLAYYVPYHFSGSGIYFRLNRMLLDFRKFAYKFAHLLGVDISELWHIYVMVIFWHEMAHHVIEDVATIFEWTLGGQHYPLMSHYAEERFCEFYAFHTAERQISPPHSCVSKMPLLSDKVPLAMRDISLRRRILGYLYYYWDRSNYSSTYRPRIEPEATQRLDGLWNGFWAAHRNGYNVVMAPVEIYRNIYCTTL